jgi:hypothetical protein
MVIERATKFCLRSGLGRSLRKHTPALVRAIALITLFTSCLKDGVLPPKAKDEGPVSLRVELVNGLQPFALGQSCEDGMGSSIRFTALKFYLTGIGLLDSDGSRIPGISRCEILVDGSSPMLQSRIGTIPNGHIEEFRFTAGLDRSFECDAAYPAGHPFADTSMLNMEEPWRSHMIMSGFVDFNANGEFDVGVDLPFDHRIGGGIRPSRHYHAHADMVDGEELVIGLRVDMRLLLLAVDLRELANGVSDVSFNDRLLSNLSAAIQPL